MPRCREFHQCLLRYRTSAELPPCLRLPHATLQAPAAPSFSGPQQHSHSAKLDICSKEASLDQTGTSGRTPSNDLDKTCSERNL